MLIVVTSFVYISVNDTVYAFACVFASVVAREVPCVVASMVACEVPCEVASVTASVVVVQRVVPSVVTVDGCIVVNRAVVADLVSGVLLDGFVKPQGYNRFN